MDDIIKEGLVRCRIMEVAFEAIQSYEVDIMLLPGLLREVASDIQNRIHEESD